MSAMHRSELASVPDECAVRSPRVHTHRLTSAWDMVCFLQAVLTSATCQGLRHMLQRGIGVYICSN